ncbi:hypothetical protein BLNAU_12975 [Blattamonas nauphoetae]|uniref:EF-hand domain-containing protein n=1 Tax=Blattamonas nauphoetae TaxID=2049346 RepID=A0ABQ9XKX8_9EUKA|nr:hypothetical protein BLNAU_12975 [Blattamonas nauphoetae]
MQTRSSLQQKAPRISDQELRMAFEALSGNTDLITTENLIKLLKPFHIHNFRELVGEKGSLTFPELETFIRDNERFAPDDAVQASMKYFDQGNTGSLDLKQLKQFLEQMTGTEITNEEMESILKVTDSDGDGVINMSDYEKMIDFFEQRPEIVLGLDDKEEKTQ